jgi:hypothetical protein
MKKKLKKNVTMEVITIFSGNLKREIKKQGLKITEFAPKALEISMPTFNKKCKDGTFTLCEIVQIEQILKVSFRALCTKIDGYNYANSIRSRKLRDNKTPVKPQSNHGSNDLSYLDSIL